MAQNRRIIRLNCQERSAQRTKKISYRMVKKLGDRLRDPALSPLLSWKTFTQPSLPFLAEYCTCNHGSHLGRRAQSRPSGCKLRYRRRRFIRDITSLVWAITTPRISIRPMGDCERRLRRERLNTMHMQYSTRREGI